MKSEFREEPCRTALNPVRGMAFRWSLNPYMGCVHRCTFCYVRAFERRADRPSDQRYGTSIRVKTNIDKVLREELGRRGWRREMVAVGSATDPYQPAEGSYRLTRACLKTLSNAWNPFSIVTRSPLIVRDTDVLEDAGARANVHVTFSLPTLDEDVWRRTEPGTAPPRQRLRALTRLVEAGIDAGIGIAPVLPGLSDRPEQVEAVIRAAADAGATNVWCNIVNLRPGTREHFLENLARDWPHLVPLYERLYERPFRPKRDVEELKALVAGLARKHGVGDRRPSGEETAPGQIGQQALFELGTLQRPTPVGV